MMRRVVVTGIGVIAAPGSTRDAFWQAISRGETAIRPMQFILRAHSASKTELKFPNTGQKLISTVSRPIYWTVARSLP